MLFFAVESWWVDLHQLTLIHQSPQGPYGRTSSVFDFGILGHSDGKGMCLAGTGCLEGLFTTVVSDSAALDVVGSVTSQVGDEGLDASLDEQVL